MIVQLIATCLVIITSPAIVVIGGVGIASAAIAADRAYLRRTRDRA